MNESNDAGSTLEKSVDLWFENYKQYGNPSMISSIIVELLKTSKESKQTMQRIYSHLREKFNEINEGYTCLAQLGLVDPLGFLDVKPQDYISSKVQKIESLFAKESIDSYNIVFHIDEIVAVGGRYGIDVTEIIRKAATNLIKLLTDVALREIQKGYRAERYVSRLRELGAKYGVSAALYINKLRPSLRIES